MQIQWMGDRKGLVVTAEGSWVREDEQHRGTHGTVWAVPASCSLQPCSLFAQLPGAVTQRARFLPVPRYLRNFFSPFYNTQAPRHSQAAGAPRLMLRLLPATASLLPCNPWSVSIHLWLLSSAKEIGTGIIHHPNQDGSSL